MKEAQAKANPGKDAERSRPPEDGSASVHKTESGRKEVGGTEGPEPTRYGDWEHKGIASDF